MVTWRSWHWVGALFPVALFACASGPGPDSRAKPVKGFEIQGHRGARARFPENTLPAFEYALKIGVDVLEMDLGVTRDGVLVVNHDPRLKPTRCLAPGGVPIQGNGPLIKDLTLAELKKYDCGSLPNPLFPDQVQVPGTRIATLDEVFDLVRKSNHPAAKRVAFNIETKIYPDHPELTVSPAKFSELVVKSFRKSGFIERILLQSFDPRTLLEARRLEPKLRTSHLFEADYAGDPIADTKKIGAEVVSPDARLLNRKFMQRARDAGLKVIPWTLNKPSEWQDAIDLGVDGIITDDPASLQRFLGHVGNS